MANTRTRAAKPVTVDLGMHTVVVCCNRCPWRTVTVLRATAWKHAAQHLREVHHDSTAAKHATAMVLYYQRQS